MKKQKILIIGNKPHYNLNLSKVIDSFDVIYRCNLCLLTKNNGTKFGKLAMCNHVYNNFVEKKLNKEQIIQKYAHDCEVSFLEKWYDFFQLNKKNFDEILYQEAKFDQWNIMLEEYGSPYKFSKIPSTGHSVIFENLLNNNEIYILGFSLYKDEIRKSIGEKEEVSIAQNQGLHNNCHDFLNEKNILIWLHNNKKIDASLCMLEDVERPTIEYKKYEIQPSKFILDLLNMEQL